MKKWGLSVVVDIIYLRRGDMELALWGPTYDYNGPTNWRQYRGIDDRFEVGWTSLIRSGR